MIYKFIIILIIILNNISFSYARGGMFYEDEYYQTEMEEHYEDDRRDEEYNDESYSNNNKVYFKNWDICFVVNSTKIWCYFNWGCYEKPDNATCIADKYNAWKCDKWYKEKNGICVENIKTNTNCNIKWNVSFETGEKIYHLPWCEYYASTIIDTNYWERYFCSEEEAIKAWWRKASNCGMVTPITLPPSIKTTDFNTSNYTPTKKEDSDFSWIFYVLIVMGILYFFNKNN